MGHTSRCSSLLHVQASRTWVSQPDLKTGGGAAQMVHMALSWRLRRVETEDRRVDATGGIGPRYPYFVVFILLGHTNYLWYLQE
jgi:hypothetical protein